MYPSKSNKFLHENQYTVKPRKWWPQKWRTSLDGGWYLDLLFLKWRGKTSENGGFDRTFSTFVRSETDFLTDSYSLENGGFCK